MIRNKQIQKPQEILIVDDFEINRAALGIILEDDYEILFAENGKEALEIMNERAEELSIVLLDLLMPVMTGFEVLERVKRDERLKNIPIIVLTAEKSAELEALQLGAADFITKPFDMPEIIQARVGRIIELSEGRQLISAAEQDALTSLYSRSFFFEYADRLYQYHPELKLDAVVLNVEQFHSINAMNGRDFGDHVLRVIGHEIRDYLGDTLGIAGRVEGDRFDVYCEQQPDYRDLLNRIQDKLNAVSEMVNVHVRMGVAPWCEGTEPVILFDRAHTACSLAKGNYQDPMRVYDEALREREEMDQRLLNDLRPAAENRDLIVYYQPKYDIHYDPPKLVSAEALIRWNHPELGMISPEKFVPLFEGNGLIGVVDNFVWQEAARQVAEWKEKYHFTLPVSVNLSRSDVFDPTLVERLVKLLKDNRLGLGELKLEVTESAYTDNTKQMLEVISTLRSLGFEIEMDDFGSGYSSLNMLSDMPIDVLKMDMKFIRNIETSETDRRLVTLILDIAMYLGVAVIAEGVETEGQLNILREAKCDLVQGYYFSKPLPPGEFEKLIEKELATERG